MTNQITYACVVKTLSISLYCFSFFINSCSSQTENNTTITELKMNALIDSLQSGNNSISGKAYQDILEQKNSPQNEKILHLLMHKLDDKNTKNRVRFMDLVVMMADSTHADFFLQHLQDEDENIRDWAAVGLHKIKHPHAIEALIANPFGPENYLSPLSSNAQALISYGPKVIPKLIPLLSDSNINRKEVGAQIIFSIIKQIPEYKNTWKYNLHNIMYGSTFMIFKGEYYQYTAPAEPKGNMIRNRLVNGFDVKEYYKRNIEGIEKIGFSPFSIKDFLKNNTNDMQLVSGEEYIVLLNPDIEKIKYKNTDFTEKEIIAIIKIKL